MHRRALLVIAVALAACRGPSAVSGMPSGSAAAAASAPAGHNHVLSPNAEPLPLTELARARRAAARYHRVEEALKDGYVDINVVLPKMGRHFLKQSLLDATFNVEQPEVLVYTEEPGGHLSLVAAEYAVPLPLTQTPPEGFPGSADQWFADQGFQLWTLHAWIFRENPDGMFNPTNRRVP